LLEILIRVPEGINDIFSQSKNGSQKIKKQSLLGMITRVNDNLSSLQDYIAAE